MARPPQIADFQIFTNSNFFAPVFLFLLFGTSMVAMAFLLSTLINHASTAQTLGYTIILVGFVFQAILSTGYGVLVDILWSEEVGDWVSRPGLTPAISPLPLTPWILNCVALSMLCR